MIIDEIDLYVTEKCNLSCDFCSVQANSRKDNLSVDKIKEIIAIGKKFDLKNLHLTGGEPTLREDLADIIKLAVDADVEVRLITNGSRLTKSRLKTYKDNGLNNIMISLDGFADYHNKYRGGYDKTLEGIKNAIELDYNVRVNSVAWKLNKNDILELIGMLNSLGVNIYSIFLGSPLGYGIKVKDRVFSVDEWVNFRQEIFNTVYNNDIKMSVIIEKGYQHKDESTIIINELIGRGKGCSYLINNNDYLLIRGDGDVYPCVFYSNEAPPLGNIHKMDFEKIILNHWDTELYLNFEKLPNDCVTCHNVNHCKGGCRGYAKLYWREWDRRDPRCCIDEGNADYYPLCPILKLNVNKNKIGGSSDQALLEDD